MFSFSFILYITAFLSLALWFFFKDKSNIRSVFGKLFLASFLGYTAMAFVFSTEISSWTAISNIGLLFAGGLFLNTFSNNKLIFISMLGAVVAGYYYTAKYSTTDSPNKTAQLDEQAELLVEISNGHQLAELQSLLDQYGLQAEAAFSVESPEITDLDDFYAVNIPAERMDELSAIEQAFWDTELIDALEYNEIVQLSPNMASSPISQSQNTFQLNDPDIDKVWAFEAMRMDEWFNYLKENQVQPVRKAKIAIIDTGIDRKHEDIKGNFVSTNSRHNQDPHGHGTHCAGIAAAVSNNRKGIASFAPNSQFVEVTSIKVFGPSGSTSQRTIINGMLLASDNNADVLSMSLGGPSSDKRQRAYEQAIDYANTKGAIVVVAAGNENIDAGYRVPAACTNAITVSAIDVNLQKATFSNYIQNIDMGIAAPGVGIYSTIPNNKYTYMNGTSMATPYVSGLVGMMKSMKPDLTTKEAFSILNKTGMDTKMTEQTGKLIYPVEAMKMLRRE